MDGYEAMQVRVNLALASGIPKMTPERQAALRGLHWTNQGLQLTIWEMEDTAEAVDPLTPSGSTV